MWIVGDAGVGKTAFIAKLTENNDEIKAVHFCRYNDSDRANPKRAIMSIAYYLSTQIVEYRDILMGLHDLDKLQEKSIERLFAYLLIEPLNKVRRETATTVLVIDALDEASIVGRNELADIIANRYAMLPDWVKIIITSRDEPLLRRKLSKFKPLAFSDKRITDNMSDIRGYFEMRLKPYLENHADCDKILESLSQKSAGNFLYAKTVSSDILHGILSIEDYNHFPNGLTGVYTSYFDRLFRNSDFDYRRDIRPVFEILCAEYSPIRSDDMLNILGLDEYDFDDIKEAIAQMFPERGEAIEPVHKSIIDWLVDRDKSGQYRVSLNKGHTRLARYSLDMLGKHITSEYILKYAVRHMINAEMYDEAIKLLNNHTFQDRRISVIGLDSAIREYLFEISSLVSAGIEVDAEIYKGTTFGRYFSIYRKFFYNTGLYFVLQSNKFDNILRSDYIGKNISFDVSVANYLYITERFDRAVKLIQKLLSYSAQLAPDVIVELNNVIALCYRKHVDFDLSKQHFRTALDYQAATDAYYDKSISAVNLGKIAYHELDWNAADQWNKTALELLQKSYDQTDSEDMQITIELFLAEYHRLIAECVIWNMDIDSAERNLAYAESTYKKIAFRDRYYVRSIYTSALVEAVKGDSDKCLKLCKSALELATSKYDKSQIYFYMGIAYLQKGDVESCQNCAARGVEMSNQIGAWLEEEEISLLESIAVCNDTANHTPRYFDNEYIQRWSDYAYQFLKGITGK